MKIIKTLLATLALLFSVYGQASEQPIIENDKHFTFGVSSYALIISSDDNGDDDFTGWGAGMSYAFSDSIMARLDYYSLEHDDFSELETTGFDGAVFYGSGFLKQGFKWYVGVGAYSETLDTDYVDEDFSGVQLKGGIGYNWEVLSLDFTLGLRTTDDYEDFTEDNDLTAASGALTLGFRF